MLQNVNLLLVQVWGSRLSPVMGGGVEEFGISQNTALLQESVSCVNIASNASPCTPSGDWNPTPCPPPHPPPRTQKKININLRKKIETSCFVGVFFFLSKEHYSSHFSVYFEIKQQFLISVKLTGVIYLDLPSN